jgi:hypothetical protein
MSSNFSGIDWDLEMNVPGGISVDGLVSASRQLKKHLRKWLCYHHSSF